MDDNAQTKALLRDVFSFQRFAVLATQWAETPYCNLVAFTPSRDLRHLFFATSQKTRKYINLIKNPFVSILCDTRSNSQADFERAIAVTALGQAVKAEKQLYDIYRDVHLRRHPSLGGFMDSPDSMLFQVLVSRYIVVTRFQNVSVLEMA